MPRQTAGFTQLKTQKELVSGPVVLALYSTCKVNEQRGKSTAVKHAQFNLLPQKPDTLLTSGFKSQHCEM